MPVNPDSKLLIRAAELIKGAPLDADLRLLLIEMIVRIDDDKLEEVLTQIEQFTKSSEEDTNKLRAALQELKEAYAEKREGLENQTELELQELEEEMLEAEGSKKIKQVQQKIQDS